MEKIMTSLAVGLLFLSNVTITSAEVNLGYGSSATADEQAGMAVLKSIQTQDVSVMKKYLSTKEYIQHNLDYPNGAQAVFGALESGAFKGTTIQTYRAFQDGDIVVLHSVYGGAWNNSKPQVVMDVFRFDGDKIVEHWDNLAAIKDDGDRTTQLNGAMTPVADLDKTEANRALLEKLGQVFFVEGKYDRIGEFFDEDRYVQHSVGYGTDIQPLKRFLSSLPEGTPFYEKIEYIHVQGNFGLMMSKGYPDKKTGLASAYFDLFRIQDGKIVEHWDAVQVIPAEKDWKNKNGKF